MKIVVAIDSFKGSATSKALANAVKSGILQYDKNISVDDIPVADGGEGTLEAIYSALGGEFITVKTVDLLHRPISAQYLLTGNKAFIETASVLGIDKIIPGSETVEKADSFGLAAVILDALARNVDEILIALGGTGSSDGGLGILKAFDMNLSNVRKLSVKLTVLTDVKTPYAGENGYAKVFAAQKGANEKQIEQQNQEALKIVEQVKSIYNIDLQNVPGSGAAGGLGGILYLLGGQLTSGFDKISEYLKLEEKIAGADLVITGEGKMDAQTANGKLPSGIARLAAKYNVPVIAFCGTLDKDLGEMNDLLLAAFSIQSGPSNLTEAMNKTKTLQNITNLSKNILAVFDKNK